MPACVGRSAALRPGWAIASRGSGAARVSRAAGKRQRHGTLRRAQEDEKEEGMMADIGLGELEDVMQKASEEQKLEEEGVFVRKPMSEEQKKKLKAEYLSFGGSTNTAMGSNYYLWIIGIISLLAVLSKLTGAI
mmetsp:Transcript_1090/g.2540  ORF Transcript_1090/g.2540 Transcript_1090/m.2540 type:complete len:134 (-) Transcript_1090:95-496(-)